MRNIRIALWGLLVLPALLWLAVEPGVFAHTAFFPLRADMVQLSGVAAMVCMSVAMVLALRPRRPGHRHAQACIAHAAVAARRIGEQEFEAIRRPAGTMVS